MNLQKLADYLTLRLRRNRWVVTPLAVYSTDPPVLRFNFTCPCGRVIVETIGLGHRHQLAETKVDLHWLLLEDTLRVIESELQQHIDDEFGKDTPQ